jgi:leader peptidase (prepilin peptidase) / N-methyltransferase
MYNAFMQIANIYYLFLFIAGTFFGSFFNLISDRLIKGDKIIFGRSKCDFCKKPLGFKNLIPIISFIIQKAKCSFCKRKISFYYPFSEALTGFSFVLAGYISNFAKASIFPNFLLFLYYVIIFCFFIIMFLTDLKYCLIPDVVVIPAIVFVLLSNIVYRIYEIRSLYQRLSVDNFGVYLIKAGYWTNQLNYALKDFGYLILTSILIALFFLFLVWITKGRGMGLGDVKLGLLIGLINGFPLNILAIFLGFFIGAIYSTVLMALKKKTLKDTVAFGPFLITGSIIALVYGSNLLNWYVNLF